MSRIRVVMFDWDGTLIDSLPVKIHNAGRLFAEAFRLSPQSVENAYVTYSGIPRRQLFDAILAAHHRPALLDEQYASLSSRFSRLNLEVLAGDDKDSILPVDTLPALQALAKLGLALYISSSAVPKEIRQVADHLGLTGYFREILGSAPDFCKGVQHVQYVARKENLAPDNILFVGDDCSDIRLGRQAGVVTVGKTGTQDAAALALEQADYVVDSLLELPEIVQRIHDLPNPKTNLPPTPP